MPERRDFDQKASFLSTEEVVRACGGILANGDMGILFSGLSTDTRKLSPGELFVALKGPRFDGHDFVFEALNRGAKGLVVSRFPEGFNLEACPKTVSVVLVRDTLKALGDITAYFRKKRGFKALAVSGSCGKTSTKEMCAAVLGTRFRVFKSPGNYNNLVGLPLSIFSVPPEAEVGVFELGISEVGEMERLCEILKPEVSLLTGVRPAHLEGFGDLERVLSEKFKLFEGTAREGVLIVNRDEEALFKRALELPHRKVTFGFHPEAEIRAEGVRVLPEGTEFEVRVRGRGLGRRRIRFLGSHFVRNVLSALASGLVFGVPLEEGLAALEEVSPFAGRLCPVRTDRYLILDDTYNANPGSVAEALRVLAEIGDGFRERVVVLGDMRELGRTARRYHEEVGREAGEVADLVLAVGEFAEVVANAARSSGARAYAFSSVEELLSDLEVPSGAVILVKGSRAVRLEQVVARLKEG